MTELVRTFLTHCCGILWNRCPPLALVQDASLYYYGMDFNKNVTEAFDAQ